MNMGKIRLWLEHRSSVLSALYVIPCVIILDIIYALPMCALAHCLPGNESFSSKIGDKKELLSITIQELTKVVAIEEIIFRLIPLLVIQGILLFCKISANLKISILLFCAVIISGFFGYIHGNYFNIFIQGVGGFAYCLLFLKYGGYILPRKKMLSGPFEAFNVCLIAHLGFDLVIIQLTKHLS